MCVCLYESVYECVYMCVCLYECVCVCVCFAGCSEVGFTFSAWPGLGLASVSPLLGSLEVPQLVSSAHLMHVLFLLRQGGSPVV